MRDETLTTPDDEQPIDVAAILDDQLVHTLRYRHAEMKRLEGDRVIYAEHLARAERELAQCRRDIAAMEAARARLGSITL